MRDGQLLQIGSGTSDYLIQKRVRRAENNRMPNTLFDKIWDEHVVTTRPGCDSLIYIDRHLVHEVSSPQAFEGLRSANRKVRASKKTLAIADHNLSTSVRRQIEAGEAQSEAQLAQLAINASEFGIELISRDHPLQGIVHVVGPELGLSLPGATIACGDSHTCTHGAFGCLAFSIGTSDVEHVLATQCLWQSKPLSLCIKVEGELPVAFSAKDLGLHIIGLLGATGGAGTAIEYCGATIENLSMEGRMTLCNLATELGASAALIAPDEVTFAYLRGRPRAPSGVSFDAACKYWRGLRTDPEYDFDRSVVVNVAALAPIVSWGTSPEDVVAITGTVPDPSAIDDPIRRSSKIRALEYMGLRPGTRIVDIEIDRVFIGSCTNSRIEDLRAAASVVVGRHVHSTVSAMVVPGSMHVRAQAEAEGLDKLFTEAGFEWRMPGCSMCVGLNEDGLRPFERCASTSNRNFEGRQGARGRTHLVSPQMAAAAAICGRFVDVREFVGA